MTELRLSDVSARCFQGVAPTIVATCSKDGEPNVTYVSQIYYVDEGHVALSRQFFNKTARNVSENPYASLQLYDPLRFDAYEVDIRFLRAETAGPLFEEMAVRIQAIATHTGMLGVFRLLSADVYAVERVRKIAAFCTGEPPPAPSPSGMRGELRAVHAISSRINRADNLDVLVDALLSALRDELGFEHAMLLLPDEEKKRLFTVASTGYGESGVGSEIAFGQGLVGSCAEQKKILRISAIDRDMRYGRAVRTEVGTTGKELAPEIPLPGLPDAQSHLGIPLVVQDRLVGVLAVESKKQDAFADWHEAFLGIIANQAAMAIDALSAPDDDVKPSAPPPPEARLEGRRLHTFRYYKNDDCVFVDGEYLVRNVPGRIFWRILRSFVDEKRTDFTNRELRLDATLGLPALKDNLESRLILLRKRLEQKCPDVRIPSTGRGHFRLEIDGNVELEEKA